VAPPASPLFGHRYCRTRDYRGKAIPERPNGGNSRNTVRAHHILSASVSKDLGSVSIIWQAVGASTSIENPLDFSWRSHRMHLSHPRPSVDPRIAHARSQPHPKRAAFWGTTRGWKDTGSRAGPRLTCVCLDRTISGGTDNICKKAALVQRVTHLVRFQAYRSVELDRDTRHKCWYQSSTGIVNERLQCRHPATTTPT
jgi:hypothetical protein